MSLFIANNKMMSINGTPLMLPEVDAFTFKIDTTKGNGFPSFKIPTLAGTVNKFSYRVNYTGAWTPITAWDQPETLITFPSAGIYTIEVRGTVGAWNDNNTGDVQKYVELLSFGDTIFLSLRWMFHGAINLVYNGDKGPNAPNATRADFFLCASGITRTPANVFKRCQNLTYISSAFSACASLTTPIPSGMLDNNTKLQYCNAVYMNCTNLTGGIPVGYFNNTPLIVTVEQFCFNAPKMNGTVDAQVISNLVNLNNMQYFLANNPLLVVSLAEHSLLNLTKVTSIAYAYYNNQKATGVVPSLRNMTLLNNVARVFYNTRNLTLPTVLFNKDTIYKITDWTDILRVGSITYSHTGTLQPIWDYELETATGKSTAFLNCTALTNYGQLRIEWP